MKVGRTCFRSLLTRDENESVEAQANEGDQAVIEAPPHFPSTTYFQCDLDQEELSDKASHSPHLGCFKHEAEAKVHCICLVTPKETLIVNRRER